MTTAAAAPTPPVRTRWGQVALLVAAGVVVAWQVGKAPPALPLIRQDLALSLTLGGWVLSIFSVVGVTGGMVAGAVADRLGHRRVILACLMLVAGASLLGATARGPGLLLASRAVEGLGFIGTVVVVPAVLVQLCAPAQRRLVFGLWAAYMPAGMAIMIVLSPLFLAPLGWRGLWLINGLAVAAFALLIAAAGRWPPRNPWGDPKARAAATRTTSWQGLRRTATAPGPLLLGFSFTAYAAIWITVFGFLPTLLTDRGVGLTAAALLTALAVAANIGGNLAGGLALHRGWPRWRLMAVAFAVMGLCALGLYGAGLETAPRYLLVFILSLVGGMIPTCCLDGAPTHAPSPALVATTNGLIVQGSHLGQIVGPPATAALVVAWGGWQIAPALLVPAAIAGLALALGLRAVERRGRHTDAGRRLQRGRLRDTRSG